MEYSIGRVSEMFGLPVSTLRFYDKEGLFPDIERVSGIRKFGEKELESLRVIECLKKSGLEIKEIKQFMEWCALGRETYQKRLELFQNQRKNIEREIARLEEALSMIKFKCWYYERAVADGSERSIKAMFPDKFPADIQKLYNETHNKKRAKKL